MEIKSDEFKSELINTFSLTMKLHIKVLQCTDTFCKKPLEKKMQANIFKRKSWNAIWSRLNSRKKIFIEIRKTLLQLNSGKMGASHFKTRFAICW